MLRCVPFWVLLVTLVACDNLSHFLELLHEHTLICLVSVLSNFLKALCMTMFVSLRLDPDLLLWLNHYLRLWLFYVWDTAQIKSDSVTLERCLQWDYLILVSLSLSMLLFFYLQITLVVWCYHNQRVGIVGLRLNLSWGLNRTAFEERKFLLLI